MRLRITDCGLAAAVVGLLAVAPSLADAQGMRDSLEGRVMMRFMMNYRQSAQLTDEQNSRLRETLRLSFEERAELQRRERDLWMALEGQLRPGVAADQDSLTKLLGALVTLQQQQVELARREQARFAEFLSPVQRALLTVHFRRFQEQIQRVRRGPGQGPPLRQQF